MTLEETVYWIVMIFFALPIVLMALVYIWRTFMNMFRPDNYQAEDDCQQDAKGLQEDKSPTSSRSF